MTFGKSTFSKESFFHSTYSLNFLLGKATVKEDIFEVSIFCKNNMYLLKHHVESSILYSSVSFWPYWPLLKDYLEPSIFHGGWVFTRAAAAMHTFRDCMEQIIFDTSYLFRTATFLEDLSQAFDFFKGSILISTL